MLEPFILFVPMQFILNFTTTLTDTKAELDDWARLDVFLPSQSQRTTHIDVNCLRSDVTAVGLPVIIQDRFP